MGRPGGPPGREAKPGAATYWDTAERHLLGWGHTLQYRSAAGGSEGRWTLELAVPGPEAHAVVDHREIHVDGGPLVPPRQLLDLVAALVRRHPVVAVATTDTELAQVLGAAPPPEVSVPALGAKAPVRVLVSAAVAGSTVRLLGNDPAVRLGDDPEAVHQARVATRRLRSDLRTLAPLLDPVRVRSLRGELSWVGGVLGAVRDLDVLVARIRRQADHLDEPDRSSSAALVDLLEDQRRVRHLELVDVLGSSRYIQLVDDLVAACGAPPLGARVDPDQPTADIARVVARRAWRRARRGVDHLGTGPSDAALHDVRKRVKQARYAAELALEVVEGPERFPRRLADLQDVLGDLQDAIVAAAWLEDAGRHDLDGPAAFTAGRLTAFQDQDRRAARLAWRSRWQEVDKRKLRRWLSAP